MTREDFALAQLRLGLLRLGTVLDDAVRRQVARADRLARPDLTAYGITTEEARCLLEDAGNLLRAGPIASVPLAEDEAEAALRQDAAQQEIELPFEMLAARFGLTSLEQFAILLCVAAELDAGYGRLFAFILDDASRRVPSVELLVTLGANALEERLARRRALSPLGTLRRRGILLATNRADTELRQELRLAEGLFDHIAGDGSDLALILPEPRFPAPFHDARLDPLARAVAVGMARTVGLWGAHCVGAAVALADAAGFAFRFWAPADGDTSLDGLRTALQEAALGKRLLCVATDAFANPAMRAAGVIAAGLLASASTPIVLTGTGPWRPAALLAGADYAEIELGEPDLAARRAMWRQEMPELDESGAEAMAVRVRFGCEDIRASVRTARTAARLAGEKTPVDHLPSAITALGSGRSHQFASLIHPRRTAADLVLPHALHAQVLEIGYSYRAWPSVAEAWGFARLRSGEDGVKALFTGDPGTGKTLAAEVIAATLAVPLLRVELSRVVSKWVGETEKNLDAAFAEAEDSQAVLLFDEADALFGKRGSVETGIDRYANLEVSHLLQRLEQFCGLVILASNLRDNIDAAFTRRFHVILHFPRPQIEERRRLWQLAFPPQAPVDPSIGFDALATLDLTGAGVMGAARAAALLAAQDGASEIGKPHVVRAIARQFRREARLLTPKDLGPYASLLQEAR